MDSGGRDTPTSDQNQKESSITLAASSMINASDVITQEVYQANLKRIQEVKEMVRKLEMNNETAHKNFLIDQLEKRAKDGREAEDMLTRLRNQPGFSETVQFTNDVPSDRPEVILPITATLVEVPESHSYRSHSSSAPTATSHPPHTVRQARPPKPQWSLPHQTPQGQSFTPDAFRYYRPSPTVHHPHQHSAAPHSEPPVDPGHTQNVPPQPRVHNTLAHQTGFQPIQMQAQQHSQSWGTSPHQVIALPPADTPAPGYHISQAGWIRTAPARDGPNTGFVSTHREPGFPTQFTPSRPPTTTHNQPQNPPSLASTSQVQAPLQGIPAGPARTPSGQPPPTRSHPTRPDHQSQSVSTAVSEPTTISELQRPHKPPQQLQQHQQQTRSPRPYPQRLSQPPLQPQQHSQQPQPQTQRLPQPPLQPQQHPPQTQARVLSQRALQPPETHSQVPPQSADRIPSTSVSQPQNQSSQPTIVRAQARQRGALPRTDQATFIKVFQMAVQSGILRLKAFWFHAKASGISDEWFSAAINSLPPDVWQSVLAQVNQSENAPHQQVSTIPGSNSPAISAPPPSTATPLVQTTPAIQRATKTSTEGRIAHSASGQAFGPYTAQLQYYAEQATKSALSTTQVASIPTIPPANIAPTQTTVATPKRDVPQAQANMRTPRDASKSRLARDILRSLGKIVPNPDQETGGKPTEKANNHEGDQLPEATPSRPVSHMASPQPPVVPAATSFVDTNSSLIPSEKTNVQDEQQRVTSPSASTTKSVLKEARGQAGVIEGPIMIDLTEDSDESVDANEQDPTFPIQPSATAATSSQPASPTNTTNHTPLLENLSLEEPPVNIAADGGNADVRMYSPPLSLVAEENMHSELLYPPPGSTEPASPSFERLPREASEHPIDGQLPLFLPSPPVSPAHTEPPETDLEIIDDEGESRPSLKRRSVDVDVMGIDIGLVIPPHVRKRRKRQVYVLIPPAPLYVKKAIQKMKERAIREGIDSELEGEGEGEELQYSHLEQLLIEESRSRLLERRCRWSSCGAILNCAATLLAHVKKHAREQDSQAPFLCRWASCQRQFGMEQERDVHLEKHTMRPLPCPFSGCDEQFDKPVEVMLHEVQHQKADRREPMIHKPTCQPIVPAIPARLGPPPQRLPSHRVIPRRVVKCRISADRHATVGPWVFWNIFSPVDLNMRKQNASMRSRPTRQPISYELDNADPRRDDYDFLLALSSYPAKNPQLDDLDSTLVTMSAARGLTLWGSGSNANSAAGSATSEESMSAVSVALAVDAAVPSSVTEETKEGKSDGSEVAAATVDPQQPGESMAMSEDTPMIRGD